MSGTPTTANVSNVTLRVTDAAAATNDVPFTFTITAAGAVKTDRRAPGHRSRGRTFAGAGTAQGTEIVTTEGVITGLYNKGYATSGAASCGLCGFTIQTGGSRRRRRRDPGRLGRHLRLRLRRRSPRPTAPAATWPSASRCASRGKISEFSVSGDTVGSLTELNLTVGTGASVVSIPALPGAAPR